MKQETPSINEQSPKGTLVAKLTVEDNDLNDSFSFSVSGKDKDYFYTESGSLYVNNTFWNRIYFFSPYNKSFLCRCRLKNDG